MTLSFNDVSIAAPDGRPLIAIKRSALPIGLTALAGPNGAGKSTLLRAIFGLHPLGAGRIALGAVDVLKQRRLFLRDAVFQPQNFTAYPELTGSEFLLYCLRLRGVSGREARDRSEGWMECVGLADKKNVRTAAYSQGMLQRLGFAYAMQADAALCVLDEPFAGVDPSGRALLSDLLVAQAGGRVVVICTHHIEEMEERGAIIATVADGQLIIRDAR